MSKYRNSSEKWYRENDYSWMTDDQFECFEMLCDLCRGSHHVGGRVKPCGSGIEVNLRYGFMGATYDYDDLTRAVFMAHDRCIRFSVNPSGPAMTKLIFHKRHKTEGCMAERHPTLEEAIATYRKREPLLRNKSIC